jgi:hypothetical protein
MIDLIFKVMINTTQKLLASFPSTVLNVSLILKENLNKITT